MKHIFIYIILLFYCVTIVSAQRVATVCGEYRYVVPGEIPLNKAKQIAIDKARNEAIANEFGQVVSQSINTSIQSSEAKSSIQLNSYASTESKAIWLTDTKEPEVNVIYENNTMVIIASVCGKARELKSAKIELMMQIINKGIETERFKNNDEVAIRFKSPVNGYIAIFFRNDVTGIIYCMLPYENEDGTARKIKSNKEYIFLSSDDPLYPYQEATILITDKTIEFGTFILVFSKETFSLPISEQGKFVPELPLDNFQKWLRRNRINDDTMQTIEKTIEIHK